MASEQERLEAFDKDAEYLNGFIEMPFVKRLVEDKNKLQKEEALVPAWEGVNLFLRVPLGINTKPDEKESPVSGTFNTFRYSQKNNSSFREIQVAAALSDREKEFKAETTEPSLHSTLSGNPTAASR